MRSARQSAIRLLQLMMVASVVLPVVLFAFAAWLNYRHEYAVADDRIERSLDILHEHTLKVFQTVERAIAEVNEIVRGMSDDDIRRDQLHLHERLKHIVDALPQVRAIFLSSIGTAGRSFPVSSGEYRATLTRASEASSTCTWPAMSVPMSAMFSRRG
jgi:two-component system NtrC family sensor kinase